MYIKIIIVGVLLLVGIGSVLYQNIQTKIENKNTIIEEETKLFQGPVPQGYNEEYFRETGITKKLDK